ncbi:hypothetical protein EJ08DRAFT_495241 [Tothia fuscella]|uniref:Acyltransferase 3 domain-containing protein n=1 Tax=Tothia fuscella TaxID=1048955 RepID=A0A9P4U247_9PEZI|nr:hypothetical protein EJ08DRAFT_495241 [Tothia fuscella]
MMSELKFPLVTPRDTKWADGLRGIAAVFVVSSHLTLGYAPHLKQPSRDEHTSPAFYNLPFVRVFSEGVPWVTIFLLLTGFVNALKPIKQARAGRVDSALQGLASSCFRRISRLVLPCTVASFFSWIIAECGGYNLGTMVENSWMNGTSPSPSGSVLGAVRTLLRAIYDTWVVANNGLDRNQWTMLWFLRGSMALYVTLLGTVRATPKYRMIIHSGLFLYSWTTCDTMVGLPIYGGALLAELSMEPIIVKFSTNKSILNRLIPYSVLLLGWYFCSYPKDHPEWQPWSNALWHAGMKIFPAGGEIHSLWPFVGILLVISAVVLSGPLQRFLSHPVFLWLGTQSFPIYLIHGPLLRSFLNWMLFAFTPPIWYQKIDENRTAVVIFPRRPIPPLWKFLLCLPIFYAVLMALAHIWTLKIEPKCASVSKWLEDTICGVREELIYSQISLEEARRSGEQPGGILEISPTGSLLPT